METVAIVGVGLIGGSFALALRRAGFGGRIVGVSSPPVVQAALERCVIDEALPLAEAAATADLVYLAQPIGRILDTLRRLDPVVREGALVTDAGSTKREIVTTAAMHLRRCRFLGGHPMAGKEKRGVEQAEAALFDGSTYVLTPQNASELDFDFVDWVKRIGARPVVLDPAEHDRIVAFTSHLPQLASTALAATLAAHLRGHFEVAGPGLRDMTRLAMSPYDLWRDILATNSAEIDRALAACIAELELVRENLRTRRIQEEFETAAALAARLRNDE
jgi:prephenate dehydrogenase